MPSRLEDFIQMTGRAGRKNGTKAYCLLFTGQKARDIELSSNHYRMQTETCRRAELAQYFPGNLRILFVFFCVRMSVYRVYVFTDIEQLLRYIAVRSFPISAFTL